MLVPATYRIHHQVMKSFEQVSTNLCHSVAIPGLEVSTSTLNSSEVISEEFRILAHVQNYERNRSGQLELFVFRGKLHASEFQLRCMYARDGCLSKMSQTLYSIFVLFRSLATVPVWFKIRYS